MAAPRRPAPPGPAEEQTGQRRDAEQDRHRQEPLDHGNLQPAEHGLRDIPERHGSALCSPSSWRPLLPKTRANPKRNPRTPRPRSTCAPRSSGHFIQTYSGFLSSFVIGVAGLVATSIWQYRQSQIAAHQAMSEQAIAQHQGRERLAHRARRDPGEEPDVLSAQAPDTADQRFGVLLSLTRGSIIDPELAVSYAMELGKVQPRLHAQRPGQHLARRTTPAGAGVQADLPAALRRREGGRPSARTTSWPIGPTPSPSWSRTSWRRPAPSARPRRRRRVARTRRRLRGPRAERSDRPAARGARGAGAGPRC